MKRRLAALLLAFACAQAPRLEQRLRDGDVIFQESRSSQSRAIQLATKSPYSHMGLVVQRGERWFVYEAVQPVKLTPLRDWIARGAGHHFVVKRLRDTNVLTPAVRARMQRVTETYRGKPYDLYFGWSDERIYCSELVWKIYARGANVELGRLQHLRDFDLSNPVVRAKLRERYGTHVPLDEPVISPAAMFASEMLIEVARE
ncbi:MAG: YiiX family permuted papain-like enzyme [Acidobacteria bacterium]|nr:YiiX family permuted papain-like enzyme [Acidobacteriota bacterium]MBV9476576.1 YiiX family permuted papain-like enzyme [Acidobacteriota bacterium]